MPEKMRYPNSGLLVKLARLRMGMTQQELSEILGFSSPQFVSNVEREDAAIPACRAKRLKPILTKEALLEAYLEDCKKQWLEEYKEGV